jgi:putative modified peptide
VSNSVLTNEQARQLLAELSENDAFRDRYEEKPAAALVELGIPAETVINLNPGCLAPLKLASKNSFKEASAAFSAQPAETFLIMIVPNLRLDQGRK